MNINNFLTWRPNCFFCSKALFVQFEFPAYPVSDGENVEYCIIDEELYFKSRHFKMSIDIISGLIRSEDNSVDLTAFVARQNLQTIAKCLWCSEFDRLYQHVGIYKSDATRTHYDFYDLSERIAIDGMYFAQSQRSQAGAVTTMPIRASKLAKMNSAETINTPYIDLFKITPEKLSSKIRTCITFS